MSILGLDFGAKRIGIAKSDELNFMAHAMGFIPSDENLFHSIKELVNKHQIQKIVIGLPITLKGEVGSQAKKVAAFAENLRKHIDLPIVTWDERLTTAQAERALLEQDMSRAKRKIKRDAIAAEIMLQSYLDFSKQKGLSENV